FIERAQLDIPPKWKTAIPAVNHLHSNVEENENFESQAGSSRSVVEKSVYPSSRNLFIAISLTACILAFCIQTVVVKTLQKGENYTSRFFLLWVSHSVITIITPVHLLYQKVSGNNKSFQDKVNEILECLSKLYVKSKFGYTSKELDYEYLSGAEENIQLNRSENISDSVTSQSTQIISTQNSSTNLTSFRFAEQSYSSQEAHCSTAESEVQQPPSDPSSPALDGNSSFDGTKFEALDYTTISKVTVIYNTSSFFAYLFSVIILKHKLKFNKCLAVFMSIIGVFVMTYFDKAQSDDTSVTGSHTFGDFIISCCAVGTGLTQTLYGKYISPPGTHSMLFVNFSTSMIGLATLAFSWIPVVFLDAFNIEKFVVPNATQVKFIAGNAVLGIVYNAAFIVLLSLTSPMFAAVGVMLTIPLSALIEIFVEGNIIPAPVIIGMFCIFAGFLYLTYIEYSEGSENYS
ncbi:hypothetical protein BB560_004404, partial [Smittium megazygosporum]